MQCQLLPRLLPLPHMLAARRDAAARDHSLPQLTQVRDRLRLLRRWHEELDRQQSWGARLPNPVPPADRAEMAPGAAAAARFRPRERARLLQVYQPHGYVDQKGKTLPGEVPCHRSQPAICREYVVSTSFSVKFGSSLLAIMPFWQ